ncbi:ATP-binding protein [Peterkaempfera bronchialis]|uniref:ATP-binding protein n=1 Tax=Peterkaempfera bronchialis TaxID=2126346 RepID=UPI0013B3F293|nr:ATP-binding protein [Peterkaempfera bronchialis]
MDSPDAAQVAREVTALTLGRWGLIHFVPDVQLCVSELVGNAVLHAIPDDCPGWLSRRRTLTVTWRKWPAWLVLDVADADPNAPTLPMGEMFGPDLADELPEATLPTHGRGLHIVRTLADFVWWSPRDEGGKSVFCRFDLTGCPA